MYLSAQKKKMRPFEGFNRKAIVCIPTQEDLKKRTEDRKKEGIELPENAVSDMKSRCTISLLVGIFEQEGACSENLENHLISKNAVLMNCQILSTCEGVCKLVLRISIPS